MSDAKNKKIRVYKFVSDYNPGAETIVEFLQKKGHDVKTHMSMLTDEMITEVNDHFKKDIEKAEKHYKKIAEFNKKRSDKVEEEPAKIKKTHEAEPGGESQEVIAEEIESKGGEMEAKYKPEAITDVPIAEVILEQIAEKEIEKEHVTEEAAKTTHVPEKRVKGLKVVGKMDLGESVKIVNKQAPPSDGEAKEKTQPTGEVVKKKKKPKARKRPSDAPVEEIPESKKRKRVKRFEIDQKEVKDAIRKTLLSMDDTATSARASSRKRKKKEREEAEEKRVEEKEKDKSKLTVTEFIAVNELANLMGVQVSEVIAKCIGLGLMVSINQRLDVETITLVADEFGFQVEFEKEYTSEALEDTDDFADELKPRPPVVTIMGHVDHGKTSLLDYIRRTNVVAGESGGITQHIGAYKVDVGNGKHITFLDTPGHEAFTAMRARGAQVTDIVVLVVAADDAVMPQTVEAINHAQAAQVPIVIAINKVDKLGANIEKIKQQLADRNVLVEAWGGKYQCIEISAKTGLNVTNLLDLILLEADVLDLKANPDRLTRGAVIEAEIDKGRGITGTILVQKGTLRIGDPFVAGIYFGKVKAMFDERGNKLFEAPPATPVQVLGFEGVPQAGDVFVVVESEREAHEISLKRQQLRREQDQKQIHHITLDEIAKQIWIGWGEELALIVKGDVDGSVEALSDSLMKLTNEEVVGVVIHKGVGGISESDVLLASASAAIIVGFHVRPNLNARKLAETNKVDIRLYNIIYDAINEVKSALEGLLSPVLSEEITSTIEVRDTFKVPKFGTVAGCYVQEGKIARSNKIRLIRDGIIVHDGDMASLKRFKDDVREVDAGYECGISLANFNDVKVGDIIEGYKIVETKKKLS